MNTVRMYVLLVASFSLLFIGCSDKNSNEACQHETTINLDKGNYDAVLASSCADGMQKGAAYFGVAGFSITNVIKRFSQSSNSSGGAAFTTYMDSLVGTVDDNTLSNMDKSETEYKQVLSANPPGSDFYKDANFYIGIVETVKSLALLKAVVDIGGEGLLNKQCDRDANGKPDGLDASACALQSNITSSCTNTNAHAATSGVITLTNPVSTITYTTGTYKGVTVTVTGAGPSVAPCPDQSRYVFYLATGATTTFYSLVTTAPGDPKCTDSAGALWPCPILDGSGNPIPLVGTIDSSLSNAIVSMSTGQTGTNDVQKSIGDIQTNACGPDKQCTDQDIANYLQSYNTRTTN